MVAIRAPLRSTDPVERPSAQALREVLARVEAQIFQLRQERQQLHKDLRDVDEQRIRRKAAMQRGEFVARRGEEFRLVQAMEKEALLQVKLLEQEAAEAQNITAAVDEGSRSILEGQHALPNELARALPGPYLGSGVDRPRGSHREENIGDYDKEVAQAQARVDERTRAHAQMRAELEALRAEMASNASHLQREIEIRSRAEEASKIAISRLPIFASGLLSNRALEADL